jgi:hypothetical protein
MFFNAVKNNAAFQKREVLGRKEKSTGVYSNVNEDAF